MSKITPLPKVQLYVGIGAVIHNGELLFVKRNAPEVLEYDQKWELPGGKIEVGESFETAIEREVKEETGYSVKCTEILPFTFSNRIKTDTKDIYVNVICGLCRLAAKLDKLTEDSIWIELEHLPFRDIIPGSKEFVLWILNSLNKPIPKKSRLYEVELQLIVPESNKCRSYVICLEYDPESTEKFKVIKSYGRLGKSSRQNKVETFPRMELAINSVMQTIEKRKKHGYDLVSIDNNHPLRSWMKAVGIELKNTKYPKLFD